MKIFLITLFSIFTLNISSQEKNDWYILSETGFNQVNGKNKLHFGIGAEYFITNSTSFSLRIKYFKTGIDYSKNASSCGFAGFFCSSSERLLYEGNVLSIPVNYKWEQQLFLSKFKIFLLGGFNINFSLEDDFIEAKEFTLNSNKTNLNLNFGIGFIYKINNAFDLFTSTEYFSNSPKTNEKTGFIIGSEFLRAETSLFNFGLRYKLN